MKSLTIQHLAPYMPYRLKVQHTEFDSGQEKTGIAYIHSISIEDITFEGLFCDYYFDDPEPECEIKPILHPLSDVTKEIEHNGERFVPMEKIKCLHPMIWFNGKFFVAGMSRLNIDEIPLNVANKLFEWNFDVFELIKQGLAIDINSIHK
jgi:hypothetical protein